KLCENLYRARRDGEGRSNRGDLPRHGRGEPCAACNDGPETWQARGLVCAGGVRLTRGCGQLVGRGEIERADLYDVRDVMLSSRGPRHAPALSPWSPRQTRLLGGRILSLHAETPGFI